MIEYFNYLLKKKARTFARANYKSPKVADDI